MGRTAGTGSASYFGETDKEQAKFSQSNATYTPNPRTETKGRGRQSVDKLLPNAWGPHCTLGNVWEWCADRQASEGTGEVRDPVTRGTRGGRGAFHCSSAAHGPGASSTKADDIGFRVVCTVSRR